MRIGGFDDSFSRRIELFEHPPLQIRLRAIAARNCAVVSFKYRGRLHQRFQRALRCGAIPRVRRAEQAIALVVLRNQIKMANDRAMRFS